MTKAELEQVKRLLKLGIHPRVVCEYNAYLAKPVVYGRIEAIEAIDGEFTIQQPIYVLMDDGISADYFGLDEVELLDDHKN